MRLAIHAVGRLKAGPERELVARYLDRFAKSGPAVGLEFAGVSEVGESQARRAEQRMREEADKLSPAGGDIALVVLDEREVLEQPADRQLRRGDRALAQLVDGEPVGLPAERGAQLLEGPHEVLEVGEVRLAGVLGAPADRPWIEHATVPPGARKITPDLLIQAFAQDLTNIRQRIAQVHHRDDLIQPPRVVGARPFGIARQRPRERGSPGRRGPRPASAGEGRRGR